MSGFLLAMRNVLPVHGVYILLGRGKQELPNHCQRKKKIFPPGGSLFPPLLLVAWSSKHIFHGLTLDEMQYKC